MNDDPAPPDIAAWLDALGLRQYAASFADNDIDGDLLHRLTSDDLKDLGVASLGHRKRILAAIEAWHAGASRATSAAAPAADARSERRQVTILFADLCGFTALSQAMDPEDLHALVGRYAALVDGIVLAYGGSIDKHIGDAVMALFGAPIAHGDDTLRAARAAIEIHDAVAKLGREFGRAMSAHIGIASGEVVAGGLAGAGRRDYTVHGDSVNLAARLVAVAGPAQTVVSDAVYRALAGQATFDSPRDVGLKGFNRLVTVWSLRSLAVGAASSRTPFVGRRLELEQFAAMLASCRASAAGQVLCVRGDPGMGKSRLAGEMLRLARDRGFDTHRTLILDFGTGKGQDAIRALVRGLLGLAVDAPEADRRAARDRAADSSLVAPGDALYLDDLLDIVSETDARALYDAMDNSRRNLCKRRTLATLVENCARHRPLVAAIEDVHWADGPTLDLLAGVAVAAGRAPALLMLTSRIQGDPLGNAWRSAIAGTPLTTIDVGPLRPDEATSLAGSFANASDRVALACIDRAGGNPLFLEQLLRHAESGATETVPASIKSLVLARMDALQGPDKLALQAASVLGQRFDLPTLRHLLVDPRYDCAALVAHALVLPDGATFLFAHALVQEGVYSSLLKARRRELHLRAAEWFLDGDPVLHAQHLDRADDDAAARAYAIAAESQREGFHGEQALALAERGLAIAVGPVDRYELTCLRGALLDGLGSTVDSIAAYRAALQLAFDDATHCRAAIGLASGLRISDELGEALEVLDTAQAAAIRIGSAADLARIHHLRGNIYFPQGRIESCREEHEAGLRHARETGSPEAEARSLGGLGDAVYAQGRMRSAFEYFSSCVGLARAHGLVRVEVANRPMVGFSRYFLNQLRDALNDGLEAVEMAARVGQPRAEMLGHGMCAIACFELGDRESALEHIAQGGGIARRIGAKRFESQYAELQGRMLHAIGRRDEGRQRLTEALALSRAAGSQFTGPAVNAALALVTEDPVEQGRLLDQGESLLRLGAAAHNHLWFYRDAIEAMIARARWQEALRYADLLEHFTRDEPLPWSAVFVARARALEQWATGHRDAGAKAALEAVRKTLEASGLRAYLPAVVDALTIPQPRPR